MISYLSDVVVDKTTKMTPFRHWFGTKVSLGYLRVWNCQAIMRIVDNLGVKKEKYFLVRHELGNDRYNIYNTEEDKVFVSKKYRFREEFLVIK